MFTEYIYINYIASYIHASHICQYLKGTILQRRDKNQQFPRRLLEIKQKVKRYATFCRIYVYHAYRYLHLFWNNWFLSLKIVFFFSFFLIFSLCRFIFLFVLVYGVEDGPLRVWYFSVVIMKAASSLCCLLRRDFYYISVGGLKSSVWPNI